MRKRLCVCPFLLLPIYLRRPHRKRRRKEIGRPHLTTAKSFCKIALPFQKTKRTIKPISREPPKRKLHISPQLNLHTSRRETAHHTKRTRENEKERSENSSVASSSETSVHELGANPSQHNLRSSQYERDSHRDTSTRRFRRKSKFPPKLNRESRSKEGRLPSSDYSLHVLPFRSRCR